MLTLAIDCATKTIGLALLEETEVQGELYLRPGRHHSEVLLTALEALFLLTGKAPLQVDLLACTVGPGSFTGLRIGVSTVKGLALAMSAPVAGVSTLAALAMNATPRAGLICPLIDAGKDQVYAGLFRIGPDGLPQPVTAERLIDIREFLKDLDHEAVVFLGDGAVRHAGLIEKTRRGFHCCRAHPLLGSAVGLIGLDRYRHGCLLDAETFAPSYLRPSEAEMNKALAAGRDGAASD